MLHYFLNFWGYATIHRDLVQARLRNCSSAETSSGNFSSRELRVTEVFDWFCVYTFFGDRTNSSSVLGLSRMITEIGRYGVCYVGSVSWLCFKHIRYWRAFLLWESIWFCVAFFSIMWIKVQLLLILADIKTFLNILHADNCKFQKWRCNW